MALSWLAASARPSEPGAASLTRAAGVCGARRWNGTTLLLTEVEEVEEEEEEIETEEGAELGALPKGLVPDDTDADALPWLLLLVLFRLDLPKRAFRVHLSIITLFHCLLTYFSIKKRT